MHELIQALTFADEILKDGLPDYPTYCSHDCLWLCIDIEQFDKDKRDKMDELGFFVCEEDECFKSYRFGSC